MTEVIDIADDYGSALEALQDLIQQSSDATGTLIPTIGFHEGLTEELNSANDALKELHEETEKSDSGAEKLASEVKELIAAVNSASGEAQGAVSQCHSSMEEAEKMLVSEVGQACGEAKSSQAESQGIIESAQAAIEAITGAMQTAESGVEQILQKLSSSVQDLHGKVNDSGTQVSDCFGQLIQAVQSEMGPGGESVMNQVSELVTGDFTTLASTGIDELKGAADQLFSNFEEVTSGLGENLEQRAVQILSELAQHTTDTAATKVSDSVEDLIGDAVAKLGTEIAEAIALTSTGASTTAMLSPVLPQLAAAKAVVGAIERALALLDAVF